MVSRLFVVGLFLSNTCVADLLLDIKNGPYYFKLGVAPGSKETVLSAYKCDKTEIEHLIDSPMQHCRDHRAYFRGESLNAIFERFSNLHKVGDEEVKKELKRIGLQKKPQKVLLVSNLFLVSRHSSPRLSEVIQEYLDLPFSVTDSARGKLPAGTNKLGACFRLTTDGRLVIITLLRRVVVFDPWNHEVFTDFEVPGLSSIYERSIHQSALSPDRRYLLVVTGSSSKQYWIVWDIVEKKVITHKSEEAFPFLDRVLAFSDSGRTIAREMDQKIRFFSFKSILEGKPIEVPPPNSLKDLRKTRWDFNHDLWDMKSDRHIKHGMWTPYLTFSADGSYIFYWKNGRYGVFRIKK